MKIVALAEEAIKCGDEGGGIEEGMRATMDRYEGVIAVIRNVFESAVAMKNGLVEILATGPM